MDFSLIVSMDSDAFVPDFRPELARILDGIRRDVHDTGSTFGAVRDTNGNTVGTWQLREGV